MRREKQLKIESRRPKSFYAKKSFGQNFLIDQNYINKIVSSLNPREGETIVEIGAGRGALTEKLVESGANVVAIELDKDLIPLLQSKFEGFVNFALVEQDALKIDFEQLTKNRGQRSKTKLVANLPYYISTAILQKLIDQRQVFSEMILMFQREVVERITAAAGSSERGFLTVLVEAYFEIKKLFDVPPTAFRPIPKIWSSVVRIESKDEAEIKILDDSLFRNLISTGFAQKRKTILNNLKNFAHPERHEMSQILEQSQILPVRRAETLTLEEWKRLIRFL